MGDEPVENDPRDGEAARREDSTVSEDATLRRPALDPAIPRDARDLLRARGDLLAPAGPDSRRRLLPADGRETRGDGLQRGRRLDHRPVRGGRGRDPLGGRGAGLPAAGGLAVGRRAVRAAAGRADHRGDRDRLRHPGRPLRGASASRTRPSAPRGRTAAAISPKPTSTLAPGSCCAARRTRSTRLTRPRSSGPTCSTSPPPARSWPSRSGRSRSRCASRPGSARCVPAWPSRDPARPRPSCSTTTDGPRGRPSRAPPTGSRRSSATRPRSTGPTPPTATGASTRPSPSSPARTSTCSPAPPPTTTASPSSTPSPSAPAPSAGPSQKPRTRPVGCSAALDVTRAGR